MKRKNLQGILLVSILIFLGILFMSSWYTQERPKDTIIIGGKEIILEYAKTPSEREQGLMFRESLCASCGMLSIFESEDYHSFWMKNTLIPMQIIHLDSNLTVLELLDAIPCTQEPCEIYPP
jgi:uncharacterized membrane protein (UPF0127 family)